MTQKHGEAGRRVAKECDMLYCLEDVGGGVRKLMTYDDGLDWNTWLVRTLAGWPKGALAGVMAD